MEINLQYYSMCSKSLPSAHTAFFELCTPLVVNGCVDDLLFSVVQNISQALSQNITLSKSNDVNGTKEKEYIKLK